MIWATVSSWACFCWLYRASPSLSAKNIISMISGLTIWWCPCVEPSPVFLEEGVCYDPCILSASFCTPRPIFPVTPRPIFPVTPRPIFPVTPGISWLPTFAFQSPMMKRTSFWCVSSWRSCRPSQNHSNKVLQCYWSGHRLGLLWCWIVCLGNKQRSFYHFWDCIQVLHFRLLLTMRATPFRLRDSGP